MKKWIQAIAAATRNVAAGGKPRSGRLIVPRKEDSIRDYPTHGLTPSRLVAVLKEADEGSISSMMQLFEEMEEKDAHLYSVASTRRLALTGLEWEIVSAADVSPGVDRSAADNAAEYCRGAIAGMQNFDSALEHLALAVGRNIALAEIVWQTAGRTILPVALETVDFTRIVFDDLDRVRILTEDEPRNGIVPPSMKFVIHAPHSISGHPQRGGLLRATAMAYLAKSLALKDWMIFAEVFGMPVRVARYQPSATDAEKREMINMLESLGTNAAGIFSHAVELQILEANRGNAGPPYPTLVEFLNREISKAWLGQTLTTDTFGQRGSFAAGRVHELVRQDLLRDDIRKESLTIRRDLLQPITCLMMGPQAPVPHFRRVTRRLADRKATADIVALAVNQLGMNVPKQWLYETLQIPVPQEDELVIPTAKGREDK
ncbi:MAG: phage portal protein family protein [Planctomycetota bacterium]|jgi:phage gp29-like protein